MPRKSQHDIPSSRLMWMLIVLPEIEPADHKFEDKWLQTSHVVSKSPVRPLISSITTSIVNLWDEPSFAFDRPLPWTSFSRFRFGSSLLMMLVSSSPESTLPSSTKISFCWNRLLPLIRFWYFLSEASVWCPLFILIKEFAWVCTVNK